MILCVSHEKRMRVNGYMNTQSGGLYVECKEEINGTTCQPQSMRPGMELVGCPRGVSPKRGVVQGIVYTVIDVGPEVKIRINPEYQVESNLPSDWDEVRTEFEMTLPVLEVPRLLRLTHAMCYFTVQDAPSGTNTSCWLTRIISTSPFAT